MIRLSVDDHHASLMEIGYQLIRDYENRLTVNRAHSEVMAINLAAGVKPVQVSSITYQLIRIARQVSLKDCGFNVAIGPLVKLWKIGFDGERVPSDSEISACLTKIQPQNIQLNDDQNTVFLTEPGMALDLGAIAKGYIADAIRHLWLSRGLTQGVIDLGGNVLLVGAGSHDGKWRVGIQNPQPDGDIVLGSLEVNACSVVTSGIYERHMVVNGQDYHHILDDQTGYPMTNDLESVTIISENSIDGEIWTTLGFYQGMTAGMAMIGAHPKLDAIFVSRDKQVWVTSGISQTFKLRDGRYQLHD